MTRPLPDTMDRCFTSEEISCYLKRLGFDESRILEKEILNFARHDNLIVGFMDAKFGQVPVLQYGSDPLLREENLGYYCSFVTRPIEVAITFYEGFLDELIGPQVWEKSNGTLPEYVQEDCILLQHYFFEDVGAFVFIVRPDCDFHSWDDIKNVHGQFVRGVAEREWKFRKNNLHDFNHEHAISLKPQRFCQEVDDTAAPPEFKFMGTESNDDSQYSYMRTQLDLNPDAY